MPQVEENPQRASNYKKSIFISSIFWQLMV